MPIEIWTYILRDLYAPSFNKDFLLKKINVVILSQVNKTLHAVCQSLKETVWKSTQIIDYGNAIMISTYFAKNGWLSCLKFAHETGCPWNSSVGLAATDCGHHEVLEYALSNGCAYNYQMRESAVKKGFVKCLEYIDLHYTPVSAVDLDLALQHKQIECVKYIVGRGVVTTLPPWTLDSNRCDPDLLEFLLNAGLRPVPEEMRYHYVLGNMLAFELTHKYGLEWLPDITDICAEKNEFKCLVYAHEHGAQWTNNTCTIACQYGSHSILSYAHEHGCTWDRELCLNAAIKELKMAADSHGNVFNGLGMAMPPVYNTAGMKKCIQYVLVHTEDNWTPEIEKIASA